MPAASEINKPRKAIFWEKFHYVAQVGLELAMSPGWLEICGLSASES
jgi:hypothetical protein